MSKSNTPAQLTLREARAVIAEVTREVSDARLCAEPLVSVIVITYNHERYLREALNSILSQQTPFPFEVLVGDDCSTDATTEIALEYQHNYPEQVRVLLAKRNLAYRPVGRLNHLRLRDAARGRYVASIEGDDYWTDATKLQRQVGYLEAHPGCPLCFHDIIRVDEHGEPLDVTALPVEMKRTLTHSEILMSKFPVPPTAATVLRADAVGELPDWFLRAPFGDRVIAALATRSGDAGYVDRVMSAYRIHARGVISETGRLGVIQGEIAGRKLTVRHFPSQRAARAYNCERIVDFYLVAIRMLRRQGHWRQAARMARGLLGFALAHRHGFSVAARRLWSGAPIKLRSPRSVPAMAQEESNQA